MSRGAPYSMQPGGFKGRMYSRTTGVGTFVGFCYESNGATPVAGVVVSDGTRSGTTDSTGAFAIHNVPPGSYTITATKETYSFSASLNNTIVTGQTKLAGPFRGGS